MGQIHGMEKLLTITEVAETYKRKPDTLWRKAKRTWPERKWSLFSAVTEEEGRILLGDWPALVPAKKRKPRPAQFSADFDSAMQQDFGVKTWDIEKTIIRTTSPDTVNQPVPAIEADPPAPGRAKIKWPTFHQVRRFTISLLLFAVVVAHGLLIWYDCDILWGVPGQIGGGTVFIVVLAALLLASDSTLPRTSGNALAFIFFVDCAAWKVHYEVFKTPVVENVVTGSLCAFICAASFIALYLFRDSKLD